jgi:hypothetical protein
MKKQPSGDRRRFLFGAGAATVAVTVTVTVAGTATSPAKVSKSPKAGVPAGQGYQLSEHVRNYYRTTAV